MPPCSALDLKEPFNTYMEKEEPDFKWHYTGKNFLTLLGGRAYVLNVTSLRWLNESEYTIPNGSPTWTHEVVVVVPYHLEFTNMSTIYVSNGCNNDEPVTWINFNIEMVDVFAYQTKSIGVVSFQNPNCPMVFEDDPSKQERTEDPQVGWALHEFFVKPDHDPQRLILMPMAKAGHQQMRAAQEFIREQKFADLDAGWVVSGASKRGWQTYLIGAARCKTCVKVLGIMPLVPIVPNLVSEMHRQYQAYGGFSFAFQPYIDTGLIKVIDTPLAKSAMAMIDPLTFNDTLAEIPKLILVTSSDEFMMMDWSNIWGDQFSGESHVIIMPNAEHTMTTNILGVLSTVTTFLKSIITGHTTQDRPYIDYTYDNATGELQVKIPEGFEVEGVYLRHSETLSTVRRDFRFLRQENNNSEPCTFPWFKIPFGYNLLGGDCVQLAWWSGHELHSSKEEPGLYSVMPPEPTAGHWTGYYIEVYFKSDTESGLFFLNNQFSFTTPGYTWPNTLPFPDCEGPCDEIVV